MRLTVSYDILFRYKKFPSVYNMPAMGSWFIIKIQIDCSIALEGQILNCIIDKDKVGKVQILFGLRNFLQTIMSIIYTFYFLANPLTGHSVLDTVNF